jgi:type VI secretion system protein ImpA
MSSPSVLDLDPLLTPIAGKNPAGESLRYAGPYDAIQEARREDDALAQGEWKRETKTADWAGVITMATEALAGKSKDLQIAAWLVEALVKRHGFAGLSEGLRLLRELQERFWESLHPSIEGGDVEPRIGPLEWMNEKLPPSIRAVAVTQSTDGDAYSWLHWKESRTVDNLARQNPEAHQAALAEGKLSGERFDKAVAGTPRTYYETLDEDLNQCWDESEGLAKVVDSKFGRGAPSLLNIKKALEDCRTLITSIVKKKRELEPDTAPAQPQRGSEPVGRPRAPSAVPLSSPSENVPFAPQDRVDALRRLAAVADFFRRTEPHSPVSYLVQRAVHWGEMPLEVWLRDVISDENVLARVRETLGLRDQGGGTSEGSGQQ